MNGQHGELRATQESFALYLRMHPQLRGLWKSPYFIASFLFASMCYQKWWDAVDWLTPLTVLPALLGFSLAAFILLLTIGSDDYREFLQTVKSQTRPLTIFEKTAGIFTYFIIVQVLALVAAAVGDAHPLRGEAHLLPTLWHIDSTLPTLRVFSRFAAFLGYLLFILSIVTSLAAGFATLQLAKWYGDYLSTRSESTNPPTAARKVERVS